MARDIKKWKKIKSNFESIDMQGNKIVLKDVPALIEPKTKEIYFRLDDLIEAEEKLRRNMIAQYNIITVHKIKNRRNKKK